MPVLDGSFEAFVTNLGKYNEGELVGEWVHFPTTEEEMKEVFERIGIGSKGEFGQVYEEWFITDYDCSIHGVSNLLGEYENLDKLNYLAARLDEMSRSELEHFVAIMDSGCDEVNDLDDLINLTYNLPFLCGGCSGRKPLESNGSKRAYLSEEDFCPRKAQRTRQECAG